MMTALWIFMALLIILILLMMIQFHLFIPVRKGIPVLMYHKIEDTIPDGLTVTSEQFENQLIYLKKKGYRSLCFRDLATFQKKGIPPPSRSILLTFDDAYVNFETVALPLLRKYGFRATLFVPVGFIGKVNEWDGGSAPLLDAPALKRVAAEGETEIGLHSCYHKNYKDLSPEEMLQDLEQCRETLDLAGIPFARVLAYPYGAYPRKEPSKKEEMFGVFSGFNLDFAVRIGNRLNAWPLKSRYEITRTDIRGTDPFFTFKTKVKKGRSKLFA